MANLAALPNLEQSVAAFRTAFEAHLALKINRNPARSIADAAERCEATWANWVDGCIAVLQADLAERVTSPGIVRVGDTSIYRSEVDPNGALVGTVGDIALSPAGTAWFKASGVATNTGWVAMAGAGFSAGGWLEVAASDFTAGPEVNLAAGTNPTVTVDGVTWTSNAGDSNVNTTMGTVGSFETATARGIDLQGASANTPLGETAQTAPHVWSTWQGLLGRGPRPGHQYCLQARLSGSAPVAGSAFGIAMYTENDGVSDTESPIIDESRIWAALENVSGTQRLSCRQGSSASWRQLPSSPGTPANDVVALFLYSGAMASAAIGDWSDGFPEPGDMAIESHTWLGTGPGFSSADWRNPNALIALFFQQQTGTVFDARIQNFRILERG